VFTSWKPRTRSATADISVDVYDMHDYHQEASHHLGREYEKGKDSTEQKNGKRRMENDLKMKNSVQNVCTTGNIQLKNVLDL
jgi:hypothetical protein